MALPDITDIEEAAKRIDGVATRTPLVEAPALSKIFGAEIYLKLECFQPIRVFKIRGAYNALSQIEGKKVVAASSGNHGLAVAYCSSLLDKESTIVIPETAVKEKAEAISEFGAKVVKYGRYHADRERKAEQISKRTGAIFIKPFNDSRIIAGQGTCGLEISQQLPDTDSVFVPVGGGGLISGIAIAIKARQQRTQVYGVEPIGAPKMSLALKEGHIVTVTKPHSIADGLIPSLVGDLTFQACSKYVDRVFTASDGEILQAMEVLIRKARIFPEPSGAAGLVPVMRPKAASKFGRKIVVVISGGNVSQELLAKLLARRAPA